ncbi:MAG: hypothetical protein PGN21_03940 [Sphingomonas paucimobilis]
MAGILSGIFDDGSEAASPASTDSQTGAADGGSLEAGLSVEQGLALELELANEMGGSYQGLDGSETTWSREDSLGLDLDTGVLLSGGADVE